MFRKVEFTVFTKTNMVFCDNFLWIWYLDLSTIYIIISYIILPELCISVCVYPYYMKNEIVFDYCDLFCVLIWHSSLRHKMQFRKNEIGVISIYKMLFVFISVSLSLCIHNSLGQSWRKNDRIEAFRTKKIIGKQFVCPDKDVTFELVTGKLHSYN